LVKQDTLAELAQQLQLSDLLRLGEGELKSGGFNRPSILSDALEAILGAIYLDGGFEVVSQVIHRMYAPLIQNLDPKTLGKDAKTLLQEIVQGLRIDLPVYTVIATEGAAHNQTFTVSCAINKLAINTQAQGRSRRAAEQAAAALAIKAIKEQKQQKGSSCLIQHFNVVSWPLWGAQMWVSPHWPRLWSGPTFLLFPERPRPLGTVFIVC